MKQLIENVFAVAAVVGSEAWFLHGYYAGNLEYESGLAFIAALGVLLAKDPIRAKLAGTDSALAHDRELFQQFLTALPFEPMIRVLRDYDMGDPIPRQAINFLYEFSDTWDSVEKEFLDSKLERQRKALHGSARELASEIAHRTVPVGDQAYISVFSDQLRTADRERPAHVIEDARILNAKASEFVPIYEAFVRLCRKRLVQ